MQNVKIGWAIIMMVLMAAPSLTSCGTGSRILVHDNQSFLSYNNRYSNEARKKRYYRQETVVRKVQKQNKAM